MQRLLLGARRYSELARNGAVVFIDDRGINMGVMDRKSVEIKLERVSKALHLVEVGANRDEIPIVKLMPKSHERPVKAPIVAKKVVPTELKLKEVQLSTLIGANDYQVKVRKIAEFLDSGRYMVRLTIYDRADKKEPEKMRTMYQKVVEDIDASGMEEDGSLQQFDMKLCAVLRPKNKEIQFY